MSEQLGTLRRCSKCKCDKLEDVFFSKRKNTGRFFKTCDPCKSRFKCDRDGCGYKCGSNADLKKHIKAKHDKIKDFECDREDCNYKCSDNGSLKIHIKVMHDKIKDFKCKMCNFTSSTIGNLKQHIKARHDKIKDIKCEKCNYKCSSNSDLKKHIKAKHDKIKDFECKMCNFKSSTIGNLKQHIKARHDKIKDFECQICNYKCSDNGSLKQHIKARHDKIKDFECKMCNFKSSTNSNLNRHIKICTGKLNISSYELATKKVLEILNIKYETEYSFDDCRDAGLLRYDFYLPEHNRLIEIDGEGHYKACFGSTREKRLKILENTQKRDKIKDKYAEDNNIPLLRIPYFRMEEVMDLIKEFCF